MLEAVKKKINDRIYGPTDEPKKIFEAIRANDTERVRRYAHHVNTKENDETALDYAVKLGKIDIISILLEGNLKTNEQNKVTQDNLDKGLFIAVQIGKVEIVNLLILNGASVKAFDNNNLTPLHWAVQNKYLDVVIGLMARGAECNLLDNDGHPPLYYALKNHNIPMITILKDRTDLSSCDWLFRKNDLNKDFGDSSKELEQDLVKLQVNDLKGPEVNFSKEVDVLVKAGYDCNELLYFAGKNENSKVIEILADKNAFSDQDFNTPIHHAVKIGDKRLAKLLVKSEKININSVNSQGETAISIAVANNNVELSEFLVKNGAIISGNNINEYLEKNSDFRLLLQLKIKTKEVKKALVKSPSLTNKNLNNAQSHPAQSNDTDVDLEEIDVHANVKAQEGFANTAGIQAIPGNSNDLKNGDFSSKLPQKAGSWVAEEVKKKNNKKKGRKK